MTTANYIIITLYTKGRQQSPRKYTELTVLVQTFEKPQEFGLTERSNFTSLTVTEPVLVNCT